MIYKTVNILKQIDLKKHNDDWKKANRKMIITPCYRLCKQKPHKPIQYIWFIQMHLCLKIQKLGWKDIK